MPKIKHTPEQIGSAIAAYSLLDKALKHLEDAPEMEKYSNEWYWFKQARREVAWLLSQFEGYSPALMDQKTTTGVQLVLRDMNAGGEGDAVSG